MAVRDWHTGMPVRCLRVLRPRPYSMVGRGSGRTIGMALRDTGGASICARSGPRTIPTQVFECRLNRSSSCGRRFMFIPQQELLVKEPAAGSRAVHWFAARSGSESPGGIVWAERG